MVKRARLLAALLLPALVVVAGLLPATTHAVQTPSTFRGETAGRVTAHHVTLQPGMAVVRAQHRGAANFSLSLTLPTPGVAITHSYQDSVPVFNEVGAYDGSREVRLRLAGTYVLDLYVSGPYEVTIDQSTGPAPEAPAPRPTDAPVDGVPTFRGSSVGRVTTHTVALQPGLVVVRARHNGSANVSLSLTLPKPGVDIDYEYEESIGLINAVGGYNGGAAARITKAGVYVLDLYVSGSYELTVEQPRTETAEVSLAREFTGRGQQVTPVFALPAGRLRLSMSHGGEANFRVILYDLDGTTVGGDVFGRLVNEIGPYAGTTELEVVLDGPHLFHVIADGDWLVRIE